MHVKCFKKTEYNNKINKNAANYKQQQQQMVQQKYT